MTAKTVITPNEGPFAGKGARIFDRFGYAAAVKANGMLYISGQTGQNADGSMPESDEAQFANAFDRLGVILKTAGADFIDIVELVTYHIGIHDHIADFLDVKARYVSEPYPAWTAIGVTALARPGLVIEIKATVLMP